VSRTARKKVSKIEKENRLGIGSGAALIISLILTLFPIYWIISTSFKPEWEWVTRPVHWWPWEPDLTNYMVIINPKLAGGWTMAIGGVFEEPQLAPFIDSAICAGLGTVLAIVVGITAALAISRLKIGGGFLPVFILSVRMFPPVVVIIPLMILYSPAVLNLTDTHLGLIIAYATFTTPYSVWMIRSFIEDVPKDLEDAAMVDGLSRLGTYFKVTIPLIKGGIMATALFILILNWSEFMFALTLTHGNVTTIPLAVAKAATSTGRVLGVQSALGVLAIIPIIVFSYVIQKYLVVGLTFGAVKR